METLMHSPKKVYVLTALVLFSTLIVQVWASPNPTLTLQGGGITIDLTYPEDAHPEENIWHNATITANTAVTLNNLTMVIQAPVNSTWQTVFTGKDERNIFMQENSSFQWSMGPLLLPPNVNGTVQCFIFLKTSSVDNISTTIYTTHVSELTFSEMQTLYNNYETLLANFNDLSNNYTISVEALNLLTTQHAELQKKYNSEIAAYHTLLNSKDQISQEYNNLNANYKAKLTELSASQSDYETLNTTKNNLQTSYTTLQNVYNNLNQKYSNLLAQLSTLQEEANELPISRTLLFIALMAVAGLVALIVYLKRKKPEPYMVIRKETVTVPQDEENPPP
jgi:hypothetical protein